MKLCLRLVPLLFLLTGTFSDDGFNLLDALDDPETPAPEQPKIPEKPKEDVPPTKKPKMPSSDDSNFNLWDAVNPGPTLKPDKPAVNPPKSGGGDSGNRNFDDSDLNVGDDYKPDGGRSAGGGGGGGGGARGGGEDQPQEAGSGQIAGIASAIGVALMGAASSYFAYQKKKLCFKLQGGEDPESGKGQQGTHSEPQVLSNLLRTN